MANYHMASARDKSVPLDGEKILFCADVIHFVMATRWSEYASLSTNISDCESFRDKVYSGFDGIIIEAVELLTERLREAADTKFAEHLQNNNEVSNDSFNDYARDYEREYFVGNDFNMRNFLKFFVSVSLAAGHFYSQNVEEARETACNLLFLKFPNEQFEDSSFWDALAAVADEIVNGRTEEQVEEPRNLNLIDYIEH